jgi:hypothetical protein
MNTQDVEVIATVIEQALAGQRRTIEALIAQRRAECTDAEQASELARDQVTAAEDRLRDFLERRSSDAVLAMQQAAAAELTRSQDLLLRRLQTADTLGDELRNLHAQLRAAAPRSAYDIARTEGFTGTEAEWLASLKGESVDAGEVVEQLMRTHGAKLVGEPGDHGRDGAGIDTPAWTPGIHREGATVQAYMGQFYRAVRDTSDEPYGSRDWQRVGTMGLHLAKAYAEGTDYAQGDLVVRDFSTFVVDARGELHLFAARGPAGERGPTVKAKDGDKGKAGRDGYSIEDMQLRGGTLAILARNAAGDMQAFDVDLVPLLETFGQAIEERLLARLHEGDEGASA